MSLLISDAELHNLYHNGQKVRAAYYNGEKVWTEKHRVDWVSDDAQKVLKTEYVTDGGSAVPPVEQDWTDAFSSYIINGWDKQYDEIRADSVIRALSRATTVYLLRAGYGVNGEFGSSAEEGESFGFNSSVSFRDNTSNMNYGSAAMGQISASGIVCRHTGSRNSTQPEFRAARYRAAQLDADILRAAGFSQLRFTGAYRFGAGEVYSVANLRVAFVSVQTEKTVSTTTAAGTQSNNKWQIRHHYNAKQYEIKSVSAASGTINGTLPVPESGSFFVIVGELTKAFKGTAEISIDNMWVE